MRTSFNAGRKFDHTSKDRKYWNLYSLVSIAFMGMILTTVVSWHDRTKETPVATDSLSTSISYRSLMNIEEDSPTIDDDITRDGTCQRYLRNFLNGTTDENDECQAFYNAYRESDCADETHADILGMGMSGSSELTNASTTDDVYIDDFFKHWECCDSIKSYYQNHCEKSSGLHSVQLLGVMSVFLVCTMIKALLKSWNVHWIPDACAFILVGTFVAGLLRLLDSSLVLGKLTFDNDLFLQIMLPPIIFEAALSIDKKAFRRDLSPILLFAGIGTGFSSIAIGWMVHYVSNLGSNGTNLPWLDSLVFGSLISSIDPVATLSILAGVGVSQTDTLYTLIFGESLLNDGVAIVLFEVLKDHLGEESSLGKDTYVEMSKHFVTVLFGSIGIGIGVGMCCTLYFWCLKAKQTAVTEVAIFFCWALIPYYIADGLHCSGIIAIMVMGFFLDYFVIGGKSDQNGWREVLQQEHENATMNSFQNNSITDQMGLVFKDAFSGRGHILDTSRQHVGFVAHVVSMIMETAIFAYLGLFLFNDNKWNLRLNFTAIASCVSSRLIMVVILSLLVNVAVFVDLEKRVSRCLKAANPFRRINLMYDDDSVGSDSRVYLDRKTQLIMLLAGVRGAVSFALVENIPVWDNVSKTGSKFKPELKTMTSSSIVFTLFVFGALTFMVLKDGSESDSDRARAMLTNSLLRDQQGNVDESVMQLSFMEQDTQGQRMPIEQNGNTSIGPQDDLNNVDDARYQSSNEWIT